MDTDFIYCRHTIAPGIKVEEITGGDDRKRRVWELMARQVYCENGRDGYRDIGHFDSGAPYIYGEDNRISISHTKGLFVVATLPRTPDCDLSVYSSRAALGIDAENATRRQTCDVRARFLSDEEMQMIPADNVEANVTAWTCKEALLKCAMRPAIDIRKEINILVLPDPHSGAEGKARMIPVEGAPAEEFRLYSYMCGDNIVTVAYSPKSATMRKSRP